MNIWLILLAAAVVVMNIVAYALMAIDKKKAAKHAWRIPEKTLFLATGLFGGLGGTLGMFLCRHKTNHWYFRLFFPLMLAVQAVALFFIVRFLMKV